MRSKWTPSAPDSPSTAVDDCKVALSHLLTLPALSKELHDRLSEVNVSEYAHLTQVWRYNSFGHHTDINALCMYDVTSMMSHSCAATGVWHFGAEDAFCLRARVGLKPGDEISISYLADEDVFKSVPVRREKTKGWLFSCACVRCEDSLVDFSRGFRCPACVVGTVYISPSNCGSPCDTCATSLDTDVIQKYMELEILYADRLVLMDKADADDVVSVHKEAVNLFSPHHWIIYTLDTLMSETAKEISINKLNCIGRRLNFLKRTFPMANYTTAWLLEEMGDCQAKLGSTEGAVASLEQAYWTMRILCGSDHPFTEGIQVKWDRLLKDMDDKTEIRE